MHGCSKFFESSDDGGINGIIPANMTTGLSNITAGL